MPATHLHSTALAAPALALVSIIALPVVIWAYALWDVIVRRPREQHEGGDSQWAIAGRRLRRNPLALAGLATATLYFMAVNAFGRADEDWGTMIWEADLLGRNVELWQEHAVLFALPMAHRM